MKISKLFSIFVVLALVMAAVPIMSVGAAGPVTVNKGNVALSGGFQAGNFSETWDLTAGDLTISFTYDGNGLVDDFGGATAHAWAELGIRDKTTSSNFNPNNKGVWLATDYEWTANTFDPDITPNLDLDDKLLLQKVSGNGEGAYDLPSVPPAPGNNHRFWWDRDGVDPSQNNETANTAGFYNIVMTFHATSATTGTAFMTINGLSQGFETDENWNTIELTPAGMTFNGDMINMQVFYGIYGYGATHSTDFKDITVTGYLVQCTEICFVDGTNGNDAFGGNIGDPKKTIQAAVNQVSAGGTVHVAAGIYNEQIIISKPMTVTGEDGAVLDGTGLLPQWTTGVKIRSGNVTFDNIDVTNFTQDGITAYKNIDMPNLHITNSKISNIQPGYWGFGIYVGYESEGFEYSPPKLTGHLDFSGLLIEGNEITNVHSSALVIQSLTGTPNTLQVKNNYIHDNATNSGIWIDSARNLLIENNSVINNKWGVEFSAIPEMDNPTFLNGPYSPKDIILRGNTISGSTLQGIALYQAWPSTITVTGNNVQGNGTGLDNQLAETLNAPCNWWDAINGPSGIGPGSGDAIIGDVFFQPWLTSAAPSTCDAEGPLTYNIEPSTIAVNTSTVLTGIVDDTSTGGTVIASGEYNLDNTGWMPLIADDNAYLDEVVEEVMVTLLPFTAPGVHDVCMRGTDAAGNTGPKECALLAVYDPSGGFVTGGGWIDSLAGAIGPSVTYFNGFETDIDGWLTLTRVMTGNNGIPSASGSYHAEATTDFTRWGGYNSVFPPGGFITSIDVYLDMDAGYTNDTRFDWTSAISAPDGNHRRDFIFNGGFYNDATDPGAGMNRFVFSASNNAPGWPKNPGRDPFAITATGWYTLQHHFYDNGSGVLAVDLSILDSTGNVIHTWTLSDPTDIIGVTVGGNRYGWFATNGFPFLSIDNSVRKELSNITGKATFGFVSKYKKGATVPEGNTEFQFQAGNLNFSSTSYDWLVVNQAGANAQFKGYGTINGAGNYGFMLWAGDGSPDTFRIKIWDAGTEAVVYDNGTDQPIGGGSIVVHKAK